MSQLFICPKAHEKLTPVYGLAPSRPNCSKCGQTFVSRCSQCDEPYNGDDADSNFHSCGAQIPWAKNYAKEVRKNGPVTMNYWELLARDAEGWQESPNPIMAFFGRVLSGSAEDIAKGMIVLAFATVLFAVCGVRLP